MRSFSKEEYEIMFGGDYIPKDIAMKSQVGGVLTMGNHSMKSWLNVIRYPKF